jgi:GDSL-like Lipase/Acylhydrolase family
MLMQNAYNFPNFQFIACSGANTTDCDLSQVKSDEYGYPDLISVTIGGDNNQAFLGLIVNCVYQRDDAYCQYAIENAVYTVQTMNGYLTTLFHDIATLNRSPRQRVVILSYPRLWSSTNQTACQSPTLTNVPMSDRQAMNNLAVGMNAALESAAEEFGFTFVDTDGLFEGNRLCDNTQAPYFQYDFDTSIYGVFHPTERGQQQLYKALETGAGYSLCS